MASRAAKGSKTSASDEGLSLLYRHSIILEALTCADLKILRYNDSVSNELIKKRFADIRKQDFWTESALKHVCLVRSTRTPCDEQIVFDNALFIGELRVFNDARQVYCSQLVWRIRILRTDSTPRTATWPCLLLITPDRFYDRGFGMPEDAFPGVCFLVANADRQIVTVETNIERRV